MYTEMEVKKWNMPEVDNTEKKKIFLSNQPIKWTVAKSKRKLNFHTKNRSKSIKI